MKPIGIDHCTVLITDVERAIHFYRDILGLKEVASPATFPGAGLDVRWFQVGQQFIHLFVSLQADTIGRRHFAIQIDDALAAKHDLIAKGVEVMETVPIPGAERFFVRDPDGNRIELIEWKERSF